ncbi:type III secretion system needle filament subunit SctF [Citrobacter freundii]|nr:type III secretion system needle filament subunit SctF [Citrobacter freundii]
MNIEELYAQVSRYADASWSNIQGNITPSDLNNPSMLLKVQAWLQQYSTYVGFESAMIKTIKDLLAGIIQKI